MAKQNELLDTKIKGIPVQIYKCNIYYNEHQALKNSVRRTKHVFLVLIGIHHISARVCTKKVKLRY